MIFDLVRTSDREPICELVVAAHRIAALRAHVRRDGMLREGAATFRVLCDRNIELGGSEAILTETGGFLGIGDLAMVVDEGRSDLKFLPYSPRFSGAGVRVQRRLLRGDQIQGHRRPHHQPL